MVDVSRIMSSCFSCTRVRLACYGKCFSLATCICISTDCWIVACWTCCRSYCGPMPAIHISSQITVILRWRTLWCGKSLKWFALDLLTPQCRSVAVSGPSLTLWPCCSHAFARLNLLSPVLSLCLYTCKLQWCMFLTFLTTISRFLSWRIQICRSLLLVRSIVLADHLSGPQVEDTFHCDCMWASSGNWLSLTFFRYWCPLVHFVSPSRWIRENIILNHMLMLALVISAYYL